MVGPVEQLLRTKVTRHRHNEWEHAGDHALFGTSSENDGWLQRFQAPILLSPETDNLQKKKFWNMDRSRGVGVKRWRMTGDRNVVRVASKKERKVIQ